MIYGERNRRPRLVGLGILLIMLGLSLCVSGGIIVWGNLGRSRAAPSLEAHVQEAKRIIARVRADLQDGVTIRTRQDGVEGHPDSPMHVLWLMIDIIKSRVPRYVVDDAAARSNALAELNAAAGLMQARILPAWNTALMSRNPADAKALMPLVDQLDKHMDNLGKILKGY